ncbi:MAG TPA: biotin-dependent carboxyltransferase family protein [Vicinamibacterales bacterium]|jgi:biotin-dependent carboxylase-like uncharacterized protein
MSVLDGGMLTTVQDLGRYGYQRYGVPTSGAVDRFALRAANRLVGNSDDTAALEMTLVGPRIEFLAPATIALTGADLGARLDGRSLPRWETVTVTPGALLALVGAQSGVRGYLALAGGIDVPVVLGSRSTYTRSRLGGIEGRALERGDVLEIVGTRPVLLGGRLMLPAGSQPTYPQEHLLRVVLGPQDDRFTAHGLRTFLSSAYTVTAQSDRMGYRLAGPAIEHSRGPDIVSDGTPFGAVQVAGDGAPIVLLADRGTAGGYTKIATVISVDISRLAQAAPDDTVRFEAVTVADAHDALRAQEEVLRRIGVPTAARPADRLRKVAAAVATVAGVLDSR